MAALDVAEPVVEAEVEEGEEEPQRPQPLALSAGPAGADDLSLLQLARAMQASGYFPDVSSLAKSVVKILAGRELGLGPVAAMNGVYVVKGRITLSAGVMAALVKRSGRYDYRVREHTTEQCTIEFFDRGASMGTSTFTVADARTAGVYRAGSPWQSHPRNMLFARAMSNGVRWYCPDVFNGPVYTPDELREAPEEAPPQPEAGAEGAAREEE